jgi:hypothetical protein
VEAREVDVVWEKYMVGGEAAVVKAQLEDAREEVDALKLCQG